MKYAVTIILCLFAIFSKAQEMNLSRLKSFIEQPVQSVKDSLNTKGWSIHNELSGIQGEQLYQTFSYGTRAAEKKAHTWFRIHADNGIINQLYYQLPGNAAYELILKEIQLSGALKKDIQNIENNQISTYYVTADYIFQTIVGADSYTIMVMANKKP